MLTIEITEQKFNRLVLYLPTLSHIWIGFMKIGGSLDNITLAEVQQDKSLCGESSNEVCQREDYYSPRSASLPPHIVLSRSQNACMGLQESAACPTKDDDIGVSSRNVKGSTEKTKRK